MTSSSKPLTEKRKRTRYKDNKTAYFMLSPAFLLLTIFAVVPLIMAIIRSFQDYNTGEFCGFDNFDYVLKTPSFVNSFVNVSLFTLIVVACTMVFSFLFANLLVQINKKVADILKIIIYVPCLISGVVVSIIFMFIFNYGGGLLTSILVGLGIPPVSFQTEGLWPIVCILLPTFWLGFGYNTLVMYAGLMNVPKSYYEAADIDGANRFQKMVHITFPSMKNTFVLMLVNLVTVSLQMMEIPYLITGGGPLDLTMTPSLYLFNSFRDGNRPQNVTIAGALLIMLVILLINVVIFALIKSGKTEE